MYVIDLVYQFSGYIDIGYLKINRWVLGLSHTHSPPSHHQKVKNSPLTTDTEKKNPRVKKRVEYDGNI